MRATPPTLSRLLLLLAALTVVVASCGDDGSTGVGDDTSPTTTAETTRPPDETVSDDDVHSDDGSGDEGDTDVPPVVGNDDLPLFMITYEGGFASPTMLASLGPAYVMTIDGRLILQGPLVAVYPGPLVPHYQVVEAADLLPDLQEILARIGIAEITEEIDDSGQMIDASTTVLTYFDENGTHRYGAPPMAFDGGGEQDPRAAALSDLLLTLESAAYIDGSAWSDFTSDRWQVVLNGDFLPDAGPDEGLEFEIRPYPLATAVADFEHTSFDLPCTILDGEEAAAAADEFLTATQLTVWDTGTEQVQLAARPLLPGEAGCSA